jgi:hypothetical protein
MTPNCEHCNDGDHYLCDKDWCECRHKGHGGTEHVAQIREGQCQAALNIKGEHFPCDLDADHDGLAHSSAQAEAIWSPIPEPRPSLGKSESVASLPPDALAVRTQAAVDSLTEVSGLTVEIDPEDELRSSGGSLVHRTLTATITITGRIG